MAIPLPARLKHTRGYRLVRDRVYQPLRFQLTRLRTRGAATVSFGGIEARFRFRTPTELERIRDLVTPRESEAEFLHAYLRACRDAVTICDVGANIGIYSVLAAVQGGQHSIVHAFEPHAANCEALRENLDANQLTNVSVHQTAVGDRPTTAYLASDSDERGVGTHRIDVETRGGAMVTVATLDDLVAARVLTPPDVVKIDVEGYELHVLRGMRQTVRSRPPLVFLELHETLLGADARRDLMETITDLDLDVLRTFGSASKRSETHFLIGPRSA